MKVGSQRGEREKRAKFSSDSQRNGINFIHTWSRSSFRSELSMMYHREKEGRGSGNTASTYGGGDDFVIGGDDENR